MALHILQPGLRPMGQFDLALTGSQTVTGGEIGVFAVDENIGIMIEGVSAADVAQVGPLATQASGSVAVGDKLNIVLGRPALKDDGGDTADSAELASGLRFLLDEGTQQYGTLFGSAIGGTAGQGVTYGLSSDGAVLANLGPATHYGSGKVTCWHAAGLYAVTGDAAANLAANNVNATLGATTAGLLDDVATAGSDAVAFYVGGLHDESLVSTSALAATGTQSTAAKFAIYFLGQR
jgi:hypothetical protein